MKTKNPLAFSERVNQFVEEILKHTDVIAVETVGNVTTITYEDWTEHPPIINTPRKTKGRNTSGIKGLRQPMSEQGRENMRKAQQARTNWNKAPRKTGLVYKKRNKDEEK